MNIIALVKLTENDKRVIIAILLIVFIFIILYLIISTINKAPERTTELMSKERGNVIYEFA